MRRILLTLAVLAVSAVPVFADETTDVLTKADQAFAAADYKTAVALYEQIDSKVSGDTKTAMDQRLKFAKRQLGTAATPQPAADPAATASSTSSATAMSPSPSPAVIAGSPTTKPVALAAPRTPHVRPAAGQTLTISLHELGNFDYNEDDDKTIPDDVRKLDGCQVKVEGVMLPLDQAGRVTKFMLVNDMMSCCYGTAPKLQNVAMVELPKDKWIAATTDRITIEGKLKVSVQREDGFVLSIFQIEPSSIKMVADQ